MTGWEPNRRSVNTVFQNYALFPHMNVFNNIAYGLKLKRTPKERIKTRVEEMLELVQLPGYGKRMPTQLSGGQRQRVAIARALANNPSMLLLDEPLGALDLQLRRQMQVELKRMQKMLGITFLYITHDQEEALNMSDRIGIMNAGRFEQIGAPDDIYERPKTRFAAQFIGQSNIITARVDGADGRATCAWPTPGGSSRPGRGARRRDADPVGAHRAGALRRSRSTAYPQGRGAPAPLHGRHAAHHPGPGRRNGADGVGHGRRRSARPWASRCSSPGTRLRRHRGKGGRAVRMRKRRRDGFSLSVLPMYVWTVLFVAIPWSTSWR